LNVGITLSVSLTLSWALVFLVRRYALERDIVDYPNARSSHTKPTPRAGGVGFVAAVLLTFAIAEGSRLIDWRIATALLGVGVTACVGWLDDRHTLGVRPRLAAHVGAAAALLPLALSPAPVPAFLGAAAVLWWILWGTTSINVVNFMDGIDGLVAAQILVFGAHLMLLASPNADSSYMGAALAGASLAFIWWNWKPAKIFMGDVGSGALGLTMALGGLLLIREGSVGLVRAYLPLYPLFLDATVTLLRRAARGERITQPHRSHLYQRLANGNMGHARVSLLYATAALVGLAVAQISAEPGTTIAMILYFLAVPAAALRLARTIPIDAEAVP